jgi:hypothetical protein
LLSAATDVTAPAPAREGGGSASNDPADAVAQQELGGQEEMGGDGETEEETEEEMEAALVAALAGASATDASS